MSNFTSAQIALVREPEDGVLGQHCAERICGHGHNR
jgi:hypothetical protein|tara:strand:- start:1397 stop:1504 length:108 start_codon:yes stop_codon:yes gene_type:complete